MCKIIHLYLSSIYNYIYLSIIYIHIYHSIIYLYIYTYVCVHVQFFW